MIRRRERADLPACVESLARVHDTDCYPAHWPADAAAWLRPSSLLDAWVAEVEGAVVGHVVLRAGAGHPDAPFWSAATGLAGDGHGLVARLWTDPTARGCGLGRALLAHAAGAARRLGLRPVLAVMAHDVEAVGLYESLGWRRVGTRELVSADGTTRTLHVYAAPPS